MSKKVLAWKVGQGERSYIVLADNAYNACQKATKHDPLLKAIGCEAEPLRDIEGTQLGGSSILD